MAQQRNRERLIAILAKATAKSAALAKGVMHLKECTMKLHLVFAIIFLAGCNATTPTYSTVGKKTDDPHCPDYSEVSGGFYGGDGSSEEQAIEIVGIEHKPNRWIEENYPGAVPTMQALIQSPRTGLKYDRISFTTVNGEDKQAYFWVSGGFSCLLKNL